MTRSPFPVLLLATCLAAACGSAEQNSGEALDCEEMNCFRPYICAESCGGPVISSGCCSCGPDQVDQFVDCPDEAQPAETTETAEAEQDRPCATDDECVAVTNCACDCVPRLDAIPALVGEAWSTMCNGGPPPNCGVQSPCAHFSSTCDSVEHRCVLQPTASETAAPAE